MADRYVISTIKDIILKIPPEKAKQFLHELETYIIEMQSTVMAAELFGGEEAKQLIIDAMQEHTTWIDDGINSATAHVTVNDEHIASLTFNGKDYKYE